MDLQSTRKGAGTGKASPRSLFCGLIKWLRKHSEAMPRFTPKRSFGTNAVHGVGKGKMAR